MFLDKLKVYLQEAKKMKREYHNSFQIWEILGFFPSWLQSLDGKKNALNENVPWVTFAAIKFLDQKLTKDMRVFEYGSGGSSIFFAERVKEVISIEHDKSWSQKVLEKIQTHGYKNSQLRLVEPKEDLQVINKNASDIDSYISNDEIYIGKSFEDYAKSIDEYPAGYFDVILIDGRARPSCFKHAVTKVKEGGFLVLDNAEREYYSNIHKSLNNYHWKKYDFYGPGPYCFYFWQTCIWQKVQSNEAIN